MCWWSHDAQPSKKNKEDVIKCFICSETFANKPTMMTHRKKSHTGIVIDFNLFLENKCRYNEESCWFKHGKTASEEKDKKTVDDPSVQSVFQKAQENRELPLGEQEKKTSQPE